MCCLFLSLDLSLQSFLVSFLFPRFCCVTVFLMLSLLLLASVISCCCFCSFSENFSHQLWSLSDLKSPQVSKTLSILIDLNNAVVLDGINSIYFKSFINPLVVARRAPITIGIRVTFMILFCSLARFRNFSFFSILFWLFRWNVLNRPNWWFFLWV